MSPPTPERPPREPDGTYRGDETDDLIDALIEAQSVNQAGFYTASDNAQRLARHELRAHIDRRLRAVSAAERAVIDAARAWRHPKSPPGQDETELALAAAIDALDAASPEPPTEPRL